LLEQVGLNGKRIGMFNLSSAMGPQFAEMAEDMVRRINELGPSPLCGREQAAAPGREI
jgi:coenzyme F420-reducing hydrogenase delta subunit